MNKMHHYSITNGNKITLNTYLELNEILVII